MDHTLALGTCPAILEWLDNVPAEYRASYCERAAALLSTCDDAQAIGAVLRVLLTERRLAGWAIVAERTRKVSRARHMAALREMGAAEKDLVRAWSDYRSARAPAPARSRADALI